MQAEKYLHNGIKLLKKKDYMDAIQNFEEYISHNGKDCLGYYYLGLAYIFRQLYDDAYNYISKAYQLNSEDTNIINALAFLNLKYNNVDESINYWLDIMEIDKKNHIAGRNLEKIKKSTNIKKLISLASPEEYLNFKTKKIFKFNFDFDFNIKLPSMPGLKPKYLLIGGLTITAVLVFLVIYKFIAGPGRIQIKKLNIISYKNLQAVALPDLENDYIIDKNIKKSIFNLNPDEIKKMFYAAKKFISVQNYNEAVININKVLHSNAGLMVKERFKILNEFVRVRQTFQLNDNVPYSILMNLPVMYENVQVVWEGKIEDINIDEDMNRTRLNLFVKEKENSVGLVKVIFNKLLTNLTNGKEVLISGKFIEIDQRSRAPVIEGIGIKNP